MSPRRNRVDPWGDLHSVDERGTLTGNRGCLVDEDGDLVRHHAGSLWISCVTEFSDWQHPLAAPHTWTPLFFLDDAVALAAGHRPCSRCRRDEYLEYRAAATRAFESSTPLRAVDLNRRLAAERLGAGRGLVRAAHRSVWNTSIDQLPDGTVVIVDRQALLVKGDSLRPFGFQKWGERRNRPTSVTATVLTPPTSVAALEHGYTPRLHPSAGGRTGR